MGSSTALLLGLILGMFLGGIGTFIIMQKSKESQEKNALDLNQKFQEISSDLLQKNAESFLNLATSKLDSQSTAQTQLHTKELDSKKGLIDQTLTQIKQEMEKVQKTVTTIEKDREQKFGELGQYLKMTNMNTQELSRTTTQLKEALASSKVRGQWGERMAEDVLRLAGFIEGVNYSKQKSLDYSRNIPDFTFHLPKNMTLNMDVKFPLRQYMNYLESTNTTEKDQFKKEFLKDVKLRVKEVSSKDYINPQENTLDYVLVFIPNESIYGFINEENREILDTALQQKVIFCSPMTLYALLAVIRQALDNFTFEKKANEMLKHLGEFNKQWQKFKESLEKMGRRLDDTQKEFVNLITTRKNQLDKPLLKIEEIKEQTQNQGKLNQDTIPELIQATTVASDIEPKELF